MGFMDKAKKLAEQAQEKLDEVQKQFNEGQSQSAGPAVEYDQHGRPIRTEASETATPPHGDPLAGATSPPPAPPAAAPIPDPAAPTDAAEEDRNNPSYAPPKLSSGDPLDM